MQKRSLISSNKSLISITLNYQNLKDQEHFQDPTSECTDSCMDTVLNWRGFTNCFLTNIPNLYFVNCREKFLLLTNIMVNNHTGFESFIVTL
ncbi:unnamed protein product [Moneuplotes crassus]|uniref:Uncharacterized protein n=1 Tax=Euplotes crassus TaxID=5936 RepID=A0AAD1Y1I7_EUPCR|nr:unnamed protein product [Moneuplotes crassus]